MPELHLQPDHSLLLQAGLFCCKLACCAEQLTGHPLLTAAMTTPAPSHSIHSVSHSM